eukprot:CAMPEP_0194552402 /NCGR_PEP_ID=MMETSP0253-20130528/96706_1 /TAXON_ID=2966 /ORGANISM="Noctiluca scintillans" /LENGTH=650 /DNA_ID=CAMNT_0039399871 /DNA_START=49 /DNA_END=1999 /DNA_ORIENTATION=-
MPLWCVSTLFSLIVAPCVAGFQALPQVPSRQSFDDLGETSSRFMELFASDVVGSIHCEIVNISAVTALVLTLSVVSGVVFFALWLMAVSYSESASTSPTLSSLDRPQTQEKPVFQVAGVRVLIVVLVILGHQQFLPAGNWIWRFMRGSMTFFVVSGGFLRSQSITTAWDFAKLRKYIVRTLSRLCPSYYLALLVSLAVAAVPGGAVSVGYPSAALLTQSLSLFDVCNFNGGGQDLPFRSPIVEDVVSVILWCSLLAPVVSLLRPRHGFPLSGLGIIFVALLSGHALIEASLGWKVFMFTPVRFLQFLMGIVCADVVDQLPREAQRWSGWGWVFDLALLSVALMSFEFLEPSNFRGSIVVCACEDLLWCLVVVAATLASRRSPKSRWPQGLLFEVLGWRPVVSLLPFVFVEGVVSVILWCSLLAPVVSLLRPRCGVPWKGLLIIFFDLLICHSLIQAYLGWKAVVFAPARFLQFVMGIVCADFVDQLPREVQRWGGWGWVFDLALLSVALLSLEFFEPSHFRGSVLTCACEDLLWCLVIMAAALASRLSCPKSRWPQGLLFEVLGWRPVVSLAPYSYGAFLYQGILYHMATRIQTDMTASWKVVLLFLPWVAGALSERFVDAPVRQATEAGLRKARPQEQSTYGALGAAFC